LAKRWRDISSALLRRGWPALPALIRVGPITWLFWKTSPQRLLRAFATSNWLARGGDPPRRESYVWPAYELRFCRL